MSDVVHEISIKKLTKSFDQKIAVNGVDLEIQRGECFGVLGSNGAGKTTLMRMMYGHMLPTRGDLFVLGLNAQTNGSEIRARIGVLPQENQLDTDFSVYDNLLLFAGYFGVPEELAHARAKELIRKYRLEEHQDRMVEELSGGLQRRVALVRALLNEPSLFFFDEPTTGLDPEVRAWFWREMRELKRQGKTIVLTTHYMEEAQQLCDRIAIMNQGKIMAMGAPLELIHEHLGREIVEFHATGSDLSYYLSRLRNKGYNHLVLLDRVFVTLGADQNPKDVLELIQSSEIAIRHPTLDDLYLKLCARKLE